MAPSDSHRAAVRAEIAQGRAQAEARFDQALSEDQARRKAAEYEELRRKDFHRPRAAWDEDYVKSDSYKLIRKMEAEADARRAAKDAAAAKEP